VHTLGRERDRDRDVSIMDAHMYIYIFDLFTYIISYIYNHIYICSVFVLLLLVHKSLSIIACNYCTHKFSRYVIVCVYMSYAICLWCVFLCVCVFGCACLGECVVYDVHIFVGRSDDFLLENCWF